jgi:hypothetical protein
MRLLEIPQWMFDASAVCLIRLAPSPVASCDALRELKELISLGETVTDKVIQAQHQSLFRTGGSDAKRSEVTPSSPVAVVSAAGHSASLGELAARSSTSDLGVGRTMAAGSHRRRRVVRSGGAR